ncbi:MAG: PilN domain-containing protein [Gemmatimonadaceae bacterium]|jgi:Tfp pilus assembly protein PilN|nr:PilN domain-containing protein [Gemmatimonadaceae bacterium]
MIEINLLPGAKRAKKAGGGVDVKALVADIRGRVKDPYLLGTIVACAAGIGAGGWLYTGQTARETRLTEAEARAKADSARFASVIQQMKKSTTQRDSVLRQFKVIRAIDGYRFVWAHLLDEMSRTLPDYTWISEVKQTSSFSTAGAAAAAPAGQKKPANDTTLPPLPPLNFRIKGFTADIQALTRYMRDLESSPFIQSVTLVSSELQQVEARDVTRFELDAAFETPPASAVVTTPFSVRVK